MEGTKQKGVAKTETPGGITVNVKKTAGKQGPAEIQDWSKAGSSIFGIAPANGGSSTVSSGQQTKVSSDID